MLLTVITVNMATAWADEIAAAILVVKVQEPLPISRLDLPPEDLGFAGARLALQDNQTTGRFQNQQFVLHERFASPQSAPTVLAELMAQGLRFIAVLAPAETLLQLSAKAGKQSLLINVSAPENNLRGHLCRSNILHIAPSRAMLTDALVQYLVWKRWTQVSLIAGSHAKDLLLANSYRASLHKFGANLDHNLTYQDTGGGRRSDTGHVLVQRQMPVFTQPLPKSDILIAADESNVFGAHLPYHTWKPSLVAGSSGLRPTSWHPALEAWGATQFQRRFEAVTNRHMRPEDYQAWMALRVLGEAASRTRSSDVKKLKAYILSPDFEMAAFKGQKLTFRRWNGQLRQPVLLTHDKVLISVSPQEGFLHQHSLLDTLGQDQADSKCDQFGQGS